MDEIKKETATSTANEEQMSEEELNNVAGGMTYWYQKDTAVKEDPRTGRMIYTDGYLVTPDDILEGAASSKWMTVKQFKAFKEEKEIQGHTFYEGDANPQA